MSLHAIPRQSPKNLTYLGLLTVKMIKVAFFFAREPELVVAALIQVFSHFLQPFDL
jgi:hypothetical protein